MAKKKNDKAGKADKSGKAEVAEENQDSGGDAAATSQAGPAERMKT